jgi:hypothetical protein
MADVETPSNRATSAKEGRGGQTFKFQLSLYYDFKSLKNPLKLTNFPFFFGW